MTRPILGIDPGNTYSAYALISGDEAPVVLEHGKLPNEDFLGQLGVILLREPSPVVVCEMIASYGMAVGATVFETCVMIGEIKRECGDIHRVTRIQVKSALCHSAKANDSNIRQALMDIYGPPGTKKAPGPTYGITKDCWAALAVATAYKRGCPLYAPRQ